ncbi:MAG TPA: DUF6370 family protein [Verrucomicrobiae bacterium]
MKNIALTLIAGLILAGFTTHTLAADSKAKKVTITGDMVCGKCTLHITTECQNVVQVKKDGKTVNYFLEQNDVSKAAHAPICDAGNSQKVTVTGTVVEKDGKEVMTPTKIKVKKA